MWFIYFGGGEQNDIIFFSGTVKNTMIGNFISIQRKLVNLYNLHVKNENLNSTLF